MMRLVILALAVVALAGQREAGPGNGVSATRVRTRDVILGPADKPFSMPSDAAVGAGGRLYVLDGVHHRVVVYDAEGAFRFTFGSQGRELGQLRLPLGIAAASDGRIFVADSGNHRFEVFTAEGKPLEAVPLPAGAAGVPPDPTDVAVDPACTRLYIADNDNHRLCIYNLGNGSFEPAWGGPGLGRKQFRFPFLIDVNPQGYVLIAEPINTRVQVLNSSGKFVGFIGDWGVKPGQLFRPKGVAASEEKVFVTDSYLGRVQVFDLRGSFLGLLADREGKPVQLETPTGIAFDAERNRLYVVELKADRVCRMDLE